MSRTRRSAAALVASAGFTALTLAGGVVVSPLLAAWLGEETFGAWRALVELVAWLSLLEFGLRAAAQPLLSRALSRDDATEEPSTRNRLSARDELSATVRTTARWYGRSSLLKFAVFAAAIPLIHRMINVDPDHLSDLRTACVVLLAVLALGTLGYLSLLIECRQQSHLVVSLLTVQYLVTTAAALWAGWAGFGLTGQAVALFLGTFCFTGGLLTLERRHGTPMPTVAIVRGALCRRKASANDADSHDDAIAAERRFDAELFSLNTAAFLRQLGGRMSLGSDSLIVAAMLEPAAVTGFFFTRRAADLILGLVSSISSATWAGLGELYHCGERVTYRERVLELTKLTSAVTIAGMLPVLLLNHDFVTLWAGPEHYAGPMVTAAAVIAGFILPITTVWDFTFQVTGRLPALVPMSLLATAVNLTLSVSLTPTLGVAGPLLGTAASYAATSLWYEPILMGRELGFSVWDLYAAVAVPLPAGIAVGLIAWWLLPGDWVNSWPRLFAAGGAISVGYAFAAFAVAFTPQERTRWRQRLPQPAWGKPVQSEPPTT